MNMQELWGRRHHTTTTQPVQQPVATTPVYQPVPSTQSINDQVNAYTDAILNAPTSDAQPVFSLVDEFKVEEPRYVLEQPGIYEVYAPKSQFDVVAPETVNTVAGGNYSLGSEPLNVKYDKINNVADANLSVSSGRPHQVTEVKTLENNGNISFTLLMI